MENGESWCLVRGCSGVDGTAGPGSNSSLLVATWCGFEVAIANNLHGSIGTNGRSQPDLGEPDPVHGSIGALDRHRSQTGKPFDGDRSQRPDGWPQCHIRSANDVL